MKEKDFECWGMYIDKSARSIHFKTFFSEMVSHGIDLLEIETDLPEIQTALLDIKTALPEIEIFSHIDKNNYQQNDGLKVEM